MFKVQGYNCEHNESRMPTGLAQGAQYMNDAFGSVSEKFTQSRNYQKSSEFRGGIWDCTLVKEKVISKTSLKEPTNNLSNKIFSLEEMLACYEESDSDMKENVDLFSKQKLPVEIKDNGSCKSIDLTNKRWRSDSEERDKVTLLPCTDNKTTRKKSKRNVSFSDIITNLEDLPKRTGTVRGYAEPDITVIESKTSCLKETVCIEEKHFMTSSVLASEAVIDTPVEMEDNSSVLKETFSVKENTKVKNWIKLVSQSSENSFPDEQKQMETSLSRKSLSKERHTSYKIESNDWTTEYSIIPKRYDGTSKVKNEGLINYSNVENALLEFDSKTKDKKFRRSPTKKLKDELMQVTDELSNIRNLALEIRKTSQSSKKNSPLKNVPSHIDKDFSKNVKSNGIEKSYDLKEKESRLKNLLLEIIDDDDIVESIKRQVMELAEQKNKINIEGEKNKKEVGRSSPENKQIEFVPRVKGHDKLDEEISEKELTPICKMSEDESHISRQEEKVRCLPVCEKLSCRQPVLDYNAESIEDEITVISERIVSPTLYQGTADNNLSVPNSRSDLCSNWRKQCRDVREKDLSKNTTPQSSASLNWRKGFTNSSKNSKSDDFYSRRNHQEKIPDKTDMPLEMSYVDEEVRVIPLNLSEPPDPLSRFKGVNGDPESIWDPPNVKTMLSYKDDQNHVQKANNNMKNGPKSEDIHAQLFRKVNTPIPRFFDDPTKTYVNSDSVNKNSKHLKNSSFTSNGSTLPVKINDYQRSRSRSQQNVHHRSFERSNSSSTYQRSPISTIYPAQDVYFEIKIKNHLDGAVEKLKILKEEFYEARRENSRLADIIPYPAHQRKKIDYSANAVIMFVRCVFSLSYKIPNWITALEAFSLGKKFRVEDLMKQCEDYFMINKIPHDQLHQVASCAKHLQAVKALKSSKNFKEVQNLPGISTQNVYTPQSCSVSSSVLSETSEFAIPLIVEIYRGLESCNEADVKNSLFFVSLTDMICLSGIQLKFITEDVSLCTELHIVCEVFQSKKKLFFKELDKKVQSSVKISFEDEIHVKFSEQIQISVFLDSVLLKMCPQLTDNEFFSQGQFRTSFESSKTNHGNKLFCIEKLFYTSQA